MLSKMFFFIFFVAITSAVLIDSNDGLKAESYSSDTGKGWQMVKLYPSNSPPLFNYDLHTYPKYEFEYAVSDKKTGDHKHHHESRDGHRVRGGYSLVEPDGSLRKVEYNADDQNGFNAVVSKGVYKHGDHAFSVVGHTRQFLPIGNGIKISRFFPGKDYYYQRHMTGTANDEDKPVNEKIVDPKEEEIKSPNNVKEEQGFKMIELKPVIMKSTDTPIVKLESVEGPLQVIQAMPDVVQEDKNQKETENIAKIPVEEIAIDPFHGEASTAFEAEDVHKENPQADSAVASSYYHSKIYYVGF